MDSVEEIAVGELWKTKGRTTFEDAEHYVLISNNQHCLITAVAREKERVYLKCLVLQENKILKLCLHEENVTYYLEKVL